MAKPNYAFEKRQRELAKKQKKEEKAREKAERKDATVRPSEQGPGGSPTGPESTARGQDTPPA